MSKLVYGVTRIVPRLQIKMSTHPEEEVLREFLSAYTALRDALGPNEGDLRIHLSVESDELSRDARFGDWQ